MKFKFIFQLLKCKFRLNEYNHLTCCDWNDGFASSFRVECIGCGGCPCPEHVSERQAHETEAFVCVCFLWDGASM